MSNRKSLDYFLYEELVYGAMGEERQQTRKYVRWNMSGDSLGLSSRLSIDMMPSFLLSSEMKP